MDLNHLNLRVRDPAACRDFYRRHFGFRPRFEAEGGYFLGNDARSTKHVAWWSSSPTS